MIAGAVVVALEHAEAEVVVALEVEPVVVADVPDVDVAAALVPLVDVVVVAAVLPAVVDEVDAALVVALPVEVAAPVTVAGSGAAAAHVTAAVAGTVEAEDGEADEPVVVEVAPPGADAALAADAAAVAVVVVLSPPATAAPLSAKVAGATATVKVWPSAERVSLPPSMASELGGVASGLTKGRARVAVHAPCRAPVAVPANVAPRLLAPSS